MEKQWKMFVVEKIDFFKRDDIDKIIKQQSKLKFIGFRITYAIYDSYLFKQNEFLMDKPIFLGFAILHSSKLSMYATYYDKVQPFFHRENLQLYYMDYDSFVLSIRTQNIIEDL